MALLLVLLLVIVSAKIDTVIAIALQMLHISAEPQPVYTATTSHPNLHHLLTTGTWNYLTLQNLVKI